MEQTAVLRTLADASGGEWKAPRRSDALVRARAQREPTAARSGTFAQLFWRELGWALGADPVPRASLVSGV